MSLISRSCKNNHIIFNVGTPSLEARNIRLVNIITYIIEESKLISDNTAVTWSKSNLNMMNIYEENTINFWICAPLVTPIVFLFQLQLLMLLITKLENILIRKHTEHFLFQMHGLIFDILYFWMVFSFLCFAYKGSR
jgi:uncharacterized protein YacL